MSRNMFIDDQITIRDLDPFVDFLQRHKLAGFIYGGAGVGKSQKIQQIADRLFGKRPDNLIDIRLADKEPPDVVGMQIPTEVDGEMRTVYAIASAWPTDPDWEGIIFLDELLNAEPYIQKVAYQIMLEGRVGELVLPRGAIRIGAGNRDGDGGATSQLLAPLANRMLLVEVEYNTDVFLEDVAIPRNLHSAIIGYLRLFPDMIEDYEAMRLAGCPSFSTPRTYEVASNILYDLDNGLINEFMARVLLRGCLGQTNGPQLMSYYRKYRDVPAIKDIMTGKIVEHRTSKENHIVYTIGAQGCGWLRKKVKDDKVTDDEIIEYSANFTKYLYDNFKEDSMDSVMSFFLQLIQPTVMGPPILTGESTREKLPVKIKDQYPVFMQVVKEFITDYSAAVQEAF